MTYLVKLFFLQVLEKVFRRGRITCREAGGRFNPNRFIETLKKAGIIARGCL